MAPCSLSGTTCCSHEYSRGRRPELRHSHQQAGYIPSSTHTRHHHRCAPARDCMEYSGGSDADESDQEANRPARRNKAALLDRNTLDKFKATLDKVLKNRHEAEKKRAADEQEAEEKRLSAQKEMAKLFDAAVEKTLAEKAAADKKEAADKKLATETELAAQQKSRLEIKAAVELALAEKTAADAKAAADGERAAIKKQQADAAEAEKFKIAVEQAAADMFKTQMKQRADEIEVTETDIANEMAVNERDKIDKFTKKFMAACEAEAEKKTTGKNTPVEGEAFKETSTPQWWKEWVRSLIESPDVPEEPDKGSKDVHLGWGADPSEERGKPEGDIETESLRVEASDVERRPKGKGDQKDGKALEKVKRSGKSNRKGKGEGKQREHKDKRNRSSGVSESRMQVLQWFASC